MSTEPKACECCGAVPPCESCDECLVALGWTHEQIAESRWMEQQSQGAICEVDCGCACHDKDGPPCVECCTRVEDEKEDVVDETETVAELIDPIAKKLADSNRVEEAWLLRGVADGIDGRPPKEGAGEAGEYAGAYRKGYRATI